MCTVLSQSGAVITTRHLLHHYQSAVTEEVNFEGQFGGQGNAITESDWEFPQSTASIGTRESTQVLEGEEDKQVIDAAISRAKLKKLNVRSCGKEVAQSLEEFEGISGLQCKGRWRSYYLQHFSYRSQIFLVKERGLTKDNCNT